MIGALHDGLRDERRRLDAFEGRDGAGALRRPVHARRIELDDSLAIGQPAISDARILGIELDDVDAGDERLENVGARHHLFEGGFDAGLWAAVPEPVTVARRHDDRARAALHLDRRCRARERLRGRQNARSSCGRHEIPPVDLVRHGCVSCCACARIARSLPGLTEA
jgi:hypothetical protein